MHFQSGVTATRCNFVALHGHRGYPYSGLRLQPQAMFCYRRKGQITNDVLFGGVSLGSAAQQLDEMKAKQQGKLE
jgi:hypothetical protein